MATDKILQYKGHGFVPLQSPGLHQQPRWGHVTCWRLTTVSTGAERFDDNAQHLPGDSSQQSGGRHSNAFGRALSEAGRLAAAMKRLSSEEMPADRARSEKSFIIYRLYADCTAVQEGGVAWFKVCMCVCVVGRTAADGGRNCDRMAAEALMNISSQGPLNLPVISSHLAPWRAERVNRRRSSHICVEVWGFIINITRKTCSWCKHRMVDHVCSCFTVTLRRLTSRLGTDAVRMWRTSKII